MVSRIRETLKIPTPSPNMWARDSTQHKDSEDVTVARDLEKQRVLNYPSGSSGIPRVLARGRLEGQRQRERPNSPADCQLLPHPFQIQAIPDKLLVLQKEKTLTVEGPALPCPLLKLTLLLEAGESQSRLAPSH